LNYRAAGVERLALHPAQTFIQRSPTTLTSRVHDRLFFDPDDLVKTPSSRYVSSDAVAAWTLLAATSRSKLLAEG